MELIEVIKHVITERREHKIEPLFAPRKDVQRLSKLETIELDKQLRELENMNKIRIRVTINDFVIELI